MLVLLVVFAGLDELCTGHLQLARLAYIPDLFLLANHNGKFVCDKFDVCKFLTAEAAKALRK